MIERRNKIRIFAKAVYENLPHKMRSFVRKVFPSKFTEPLFKQLPFLVPYSLHIDPTNLCNFRCNFCPTGDFELLKSVGRPKGLMSFDLFKKIIDELSELCRETDQKVHELHLYKDGEPLVHKELGRMAGYAKSKDVAVYVQTTTNAALLNKERAVELVESGLDIIRISVEHVNDDGYKSITQNYSDFNSVKENVKFLFEEKNRRKSKLIVKVKMIDAGFDENVIQKFFDEFSPISDSISVNNLMGWSYSDIKDFTLGKKVKRNMGGASKLEDKKVCPEPFRSLAVNFNGQVSVCCVDWSMGAIVGDINVQSFKEIWTGEQLNNFRKLHLSGNKNQIKPCANCHYLMGFPDHLYLDDKTEMLKKIYLS